MSLLGIIDLKLGNIGSIKRMVEKVGGSTLIIDDPCKLDDVNKVILPGVGHFDNGIKQLRKNSFDSQLVDRLEKRQLDLLGICLGMQLLCKSSEEGKEEGLGLIDAEVIKINSTEERNLKVPHMGWNVVKSVKHNLIIPEIEEKQRFYFVHSFKVVPSNDNIIIGKSFYGGEFCSAFQSRNITGVQFHPEKSHRFGMSLMKRFVHM